MRFRALTSVARGYALALMIGLVLAASGAEEVPVLLAIWLGGAVLTLGLATAVSQNRMERLPARVTRCPSE